MPREHATITLTADEIVDFLAGQHVCIVASLDPDGMPWGDAASCVLHDGLLYFRVAAGSHTLANLANDRRVCCTVEWKGPDYYSARAAMVHGSCVPVASDHAVAAAFASLADPITGTPVDGTFFSVDLEQVVSFDFAKIQRRFQQG